MGNKKVRGMMNMAEKAVLGPNLVGLSCQGSRKPFNGLDDLKRLGYHMVDGAINVRASQERGHEGCEKVLRWVCWVALMMITKRMQLMRSRLSSGGREKEDARKIKIS
jgi:hypothetical protein